jgi:hypothetical protein
MRNPIGRPWLGYEKRPEDSGSRESAESPESRKLTYASDAPKSATTARTRTRTRTV